jgi:hypothetical protein
MSSRGNSYGKYLCKDDMGTRLSQTTQIDSSIPIVKYNLAISYI